MDLETVKEHFKNAKKVRCLSDGGIYEIDHNTIYCVGDFWCSDVNSRVVKLYSKETFAEIISFKDISESVNNSEPIFIKESAILTPLHYNNENGTLYKDKPKEIKNDPVVSSVMFQLAQRSILGQSKYGTTLAENNKDNFLQHLKEELMDAILYIEKLQSNDN
jgi:hypothetical protein